MAVHHLFYICLHVVEKWLFQLWLQLGRTMPGQGCPYLLLIYPTLGLENRVQYWNHNVWWSVRGLLQIIMICRFQFIHAEIHSTAHLHVFDSIRFVNSHSLCWGGQTYKSHNLLLRTNFHSTQQDCLSIIESMWAVSLEVNVVSRQEC